MVSANTHVSWTHFYFHTHTHTHTHTRTHTYICIHIDIYIVCVFVKSSEATTNSCPLLLMAMSRTGVKAMLV